VQAATAETEERVTSPPDPRPSLPSVPSEPREERIFRDAVSDFEMSVAGYLEDTRSQYVMEDARKRLMQLYRDKKP
jgi:hypothetical protein